MSRLRRLKGRKSIMKFTSYGLALALVLGSTQGLGTYALFTDTENVSSELAISTGDVDVEINGGKKLTNLKPGDKEELSFEITNKGTLNQNLELKIDGSLKEYIKYEFDLFNLNVCTNGYVYKDKELEELFVLAPGEVLTGNIHITIDDMNKDDQNELSQESQNINLKVTSRQINSDKKFSTNGFYDEETQINSITIVPPTEEKPPIEEDDNIMPPGKDGAIKVTSPGHLAKGNHFYIEFYNNNEKYQGLLYIIDKLDGGLKANPDNIKIIHQSGAFEQSKVWLSANQGSKPNEKDKNSPKGISAEPVDGTLIKDNFEDSYIDIQIDYGNNIFKSYRIDFRAKEKEGNRLAEAKVTLLGTQVIQEDESLNEEIEVPNKPEVVNPPNEEIEVPNKPEAVNPPNEEIEVPNKPEVIEPPKEEEIEIPNKPEVIEPPKENEELQ